MKVSATGLLRGVRDILNSKSPYADMYKFSLDEMIKHIQSVNNGEATLQEFAELYCIVPKSNEYSGDGK